MRHSQSEVTGKWYGVAVAACLMMAAAAPVRAGDAMAFPESDEILNTPGVFTGKDGGFVVTVWRDGRRTFGDSPPKASQITGDVGYGRRQPSDQAARKSSFRPGQPRRRSIVADAATSD